MTVWNTLVRDKIPEALIKEGKLFRTKKLKDGEYMDNLVNRLVVEAEQVKIHWFGHGEGHKQVMHERLADVLEVVYAISDKFGLDKEELEQLRLRLEAELGKLSQDAYITEVI